jgi:hypothetical protein
MKGPCTYCGRVLTRSGMAKHLVTCAERRARVSEADGTSAHRELLFLMEIRDASTGWFWLFLEVSGDATMGVIDKYLRAIWLECCGHSSQWFVGAAWSGRKVAMTARAASVFRDRVELSHVYDSGDTTVTKARIIGTRSGVTTTGRPISLMARNGAPMIQCNQCDRPAEWLCLQCVHEDGNDGGLCGIHRESHPHEDYGHPLPVVNSPRMGICGYEGPSDPPY